MLFSGIIIIVLNILSWISDGLGLCYGYLIFCLFIVLITLLTEHKQKAQDLKVSPSVEDNP